MRIYGVNQALRFVEGIWLPQKIRQIRFFFLGKDTFFTCAQQFFSTMAANNSRDIMCPLYKYVLILVIICQ
mgnify:CR=1 FL=1